MYRFTLGNIVFPITPDKVTITDKSKNETISLIDEGEVSLLKKPGLKEVSFQATLPRVSYPFSIAKTDAEDILKELQLYKNTRRVIPFQIKRKLEKKTSNKIKLKKTDMQVTMEDLEQEEDAGNGSDIVVTIRLKEYKKFGGKRIVQKKYGTGKLNAYDPSKRQTKNTTITYVVKQGDCLYNIAKKQLNKASKWKEIYKLNKKVIEETAKKHGRKSSSNGHYIYSGTKLKLPK